MTRIQSIDVLRAVTMLLMVWVNDFWSLQNVPRWLGHMPGDVDGLGFSDVIFPAFLVIVGLSIPFAIENRRSKGDGVVEIQRHIIGRSFALIVMGFFMVNLEYAGPEDLMMPRPLWQVLMILAFGLIWNAYPRSWQEGRLALGCKVAGWGLLAILAGTYGGGIGSENGMAPRWWGILGLIGWAYLVGATLCLHLGTRLLGVAVAWLFFLLFNVASFAGWLAPLEAARPYLWLVGEGSMAAFVMAGVLVSTAQLRGGSLAETKKFLAFLIGFGALLLTLGFALRPFWGISKIQSTPAWTAMCTGLTFWAYAALYGLVDGLGKVGWARVLGAAGTATLTCYLVPYLAYPAWQATGWQSPEALRNGWLGLASSMGFAFAVVWITAGLVKIGIRLRI